MEPLLLLPNDRATTSSVLRENHPLSWTITTTFELLGKWVLCGIHSSRHGMACVLVKNVVVWLKIVTKNII
jgi:hypothetical protein